MSEELDKMMSEHRKLTRSIYLRIFNEVIIPVVKRANYAITWAMGSVDFTTEKGTDLDYESVIYTNLEKKIKGYIIDMGMDFNVRCGALWSFMGEIQANGCYTLEHGFEEFEKHLIRRPVGKKV